MSELKEFILKTIKCAYNDTARSTVEYIFSVYNGDIKDLFFVDSDITIYNPLIDIANNNYEFTWQKHGYSKESYKLLMFLLDQLDETTISLLNTPCILFEKIDGNKKSTFLEMILENSICSNSSMNLARKALSKGASLEHCRHLNSILIRLAINNNSSEKNYKNTSSENVELYFQFIESIIQKILQQSNSEKTKHTLDSSLRYAKRNNDTRLIDLINKYA